MLLYSFFITAALTEHVSEAELRVRQPPVKPQADFQTLERRQVPDDDSVPKKANLESSHTRKRLPVWRGLSRSEALVSAPKRLNFTKVDITEEVRETEIGSYTTSQIPYSEKPFKTRKGVATKKYLVSVDASSAEINTIQLEANPLKKKKNKKKRAKKSSRNR